MHQRRSLVDYEVAPSLELAQEVAGYDRSFKNAKPGLQPADLFEHARGNVTRVANRAITGPLGVVVPVRLLPVIQIRLSTFAVPLVSFRFRQLASPLR
jgi:hypothetical protein